MSEKYQIRGSFRYGIKQYFVVDTQRTGMQVGLGEITHDPIQKHEAEFLCAKLNHLAALEKVCREIMATISTKEALGVDGQYEYQIAQKLKTALEEGNGKS